MKIAVKDVFCEVLSGLGFVFVLLPILQWCGALDLTSSRALLVASLEPAGLVVLLLAAYCAGVIFDAVGLLLDGLLTPLFKIQVSSGDQKLKFWSKVTEHGLTYRNTQWAYYSCYRNLLVLVPIACVEWCVVLWRDEPGIACVILGCSAVLTFVFWRAAKMLHNFYWEITTAMGA